MGLPTINPNDILNVALSNNNTVATQTSANSTPGACRTTNPQSGGIFYFEATVQGSSGPGVGITGQYTSLSDIANSGTNSALMYVTYYTQGPVFVNSTLVGQIGFFGSDQNVGVCLDVNRSLIYFRNNSVDVTYGWNAIPVWNNGSYSGGSVVDLPALGTGAASYSLFGPGTTEVYPMWFFMPNRSVDQQVTLVTQASSLLGNVPTGFSTLGASAWDPAKTNGSGSVLSNSNMTAKCPAGVNHTVTVIGTVGATTGKIYFEIQCDEVDVSAGNNNNNGPGISDAANVHTVTIRGNQAINQDQNTIMGIAAQSFQEFSGYRIGIAVDLNAGNIWYRNLGSQPSAGLGGISTSGLTGPFLPAGKTEDFEQQVQFGFYNYTGNIPSGVSGWPGTSSLSLFINT